MFTLIGVPVSCVLEIRHLIYLGLCSKTRQYCSDGPLLLLKMPILRSCVLKVQYHTCVSCLQHYVLL